ncbi:hypothetical protein [uncultured Thiothrix sp.]|uniref:hypothetical protein n=1 Tax=uncultured Thiothrix sp. TaxID=223185 RepID=UPI00260AB46A|nr:hypothetical protein [uncultured Thiothrix sp.]HMT94298.1 hypothetical protein [Thiolinea sp.]
MLAKPIPFIFSALLGTSVLAATLAYAAPNQTPKPNANKPRNTFETQIIKLDARTHNLDNPITLSIPQGSYEVKPVGKTAGGKYEAWSVWDRTNCPRSKGCPRIVPTRFTGMHNNYYVSSPDLSKVTVAGKELPAVKEIPQYRDSSYFLQDGNTRAYEVTENYTYPDEASALAAAKASIFTINKDSQVSFMLLDLSRSTDNRGGMTLQVRKVN